METILIYGITRDDGYYSDPDAAIDKYHYWRKVDNATWKAFWNTRQAVVDEVKSGTTIAYTYPNGHRGALCEVKVSQNGVEYLKTVPNGNPNDNLHSLPEYE